MNCWIAPRSGVRTKNLVSGPRLRPWSAGVLVAPVSRAGGAATLAAAALADPGDGERHEAAGDQS